MTEHRSGAATLRVNAPTHGVVLYTGAWFPEWTATVDGIETDVLITDGCFIGVSVSEGTHEIRLTFKPTAFYWGLPFWGLGFCGFLLLRRRSKSTIVAKLEPF